MQVHKEHKDPTTQRTPRTGTREFQGTLAAIHDVSRDALFAKAAADEARHAQIIFGQQ